VEPPCIVKYRMPDNNNTCNVMIVVFMGETIYQRSAPVRYHLGNIQ